MRDCMAATLAAFILLFGLPWLRAEDTPDKPESQPTERKDAQITLRVQDGDEIREMTVADYLPGVVRGEMPASFEAEALKSQAVAERTYIYYKLSTGGKAAHPRADVCTDSRCCAAYTSKKAAAKKWGAKADKYEKRIQQAVRDTDGQVMLYDDQPILAVFHSSSGGATASSGDVWSQDLPYLTSVESPESKSTVPNYYSVQEVSADHFQDTFRAAHPTAYFSSDPSTWVEHLQYNDSGRVEKATIGGVAAEGTEIRALYGLRSADFTVDCTKKTVTFHVTGYGHGVGLSQYGANELARQGKTWQEILHWYYTDVQITDDHLPSRQRG